MEQRQLEFFVAVAEELNFTRAAKRTHAVQSTVSASIRALERDLGTPLFDRSTTRVTLTDAGRALLPEAKNALESLDLARAAVGSAGLGLRGSLRVGTLSGLTAVDLPGLVGDFRERHPGVRLTMTVAAEGSSGLLEKLRSHQLDVAFVGVDTAAVDGIDLTPLATFQPRLLVSENHPLAGAATVDPGALADEQFIDLPAGYCNRVRSDNDFRRAGLTRSIVVEVTDLTTVPSYVAAGLGVAVVPPLRAEAGARVVPVDLDPPATPWTLAVARPAAIPPSRAVRAFLDLIPAHTATTSEY
ncbi:putative LysR-family transcriptional regulator [Actinoplanes missouriensis 431]|uniref:Putative LysR-family transcriptional regulator n=1 Tax=Actinoplanes missouriensis (strain ATCC 14538 / DSM 43046 / CBS 188.64 / JCM 3121 / NBRC 102363 / NCIMB 12654 / NRRL B-3342 / UNCC 431) TaxID=512565 RepID=I0H7Y0_ACTM4|nr:LysR family transcriptional regulator [Actinoplanes missouriensis]BAL89117.1 putative LysR-family transcriptional regulator [Actinoplanes missouriensis 431]